MSSSTPAAPAPTPTPPAPSPAEHSTCYRKLATATQPTPLQRLADLAPTLKEAELRVLVHLAALAESSHAHCVSISARHIARVIKGSRRFIQSALDSLAHRGLITTRQGTATRPAIHQINVLETLSIGGALAAPPPALQQRLPGVPEAPPVALFERHPRALTAPPTTPNQQVAPLTAAVDSIYDSTSTIDRLLRAKPHQFDTKLLETARHWLHGYQLKFGRDPNAHPPDDPITAQFLAVADWIQLERLLYDLMAERKEPGTSYAWYVTVALQRIHGIQPTRLKARRAELKLLGTNPSPSAEADPDFSRQLLAHVAAKVRTL